MAIEMAALCVDSDACIWYFSVDEPWMSRIVPFEYKFFAYSALLYPIVRIRFTSSFSTNFSEPSFIPYFSLDLWKLYSF